MKTNNFEQVIDRYLLTREFFKSFLDILQAYGADRQICFGHGVDGEMEGTGRRDLDKKRLNNLGWTFIE